MSKPSCRHRDHVLCMISSSCRGDVGHRTSVTNLQHKPTPLDRMKDCRDPLERKSVREKTGGGLPSLELAVFGPGLSRWDAQKAGSLNPQESKIFNEALDWMGRLSSKAQELSTTITTAGKVRENEQTVYVMCNQNGRSVQGFLRLGRKHLFLYSDGGSMHEGDVLCLLDFYVHIRLQRQGIGAKLFTAALQREGVAPTEIAYDRPSPKLKPFLRRHFGLSNCLDQPNRFMVFKEYFSGAAMRSKQAG